eukprot:gene4445-5456_t
MQLDEAEAPLGPRREALQVARGVQVKWLREFARLPEVHGLHTYEVVEALVKLHTANTRCRYVELETMVPFVGRAQVFVSHTWGALFADTVAAIGYSLPDEAYVWFDIFAVRQWPGNLADLSFKSIVRDTAALLLCAVHLDSVACLDDFDKWLGHFSLPADALRQCAFFRVWCLVELASALTAQKPVVMMIGAASVDGSFETNIAMVNNLVRLVDVTKASASVEEDRVRILQELGQEVPLLNRLARRAIAGAAYGMDRPEMIAAACGFTQRLETFCAEFKGGLADVTNTVDALCAAVGAKWSIPVMSLLASGVPVGQTGKHGHTPLAVAALMGNVKEIQLLLEAGADVDQEMKDNTTAIMFAAQEEHLEAVQALVHAGATLEVLDDRGRMPLLIAARNAHTEMVHTMLSAGVDPDCGTEINHSSVCRAAEAGCLDTVRALIDAGASLDLHEDKKGLTPLHIAAMRGDAQIARTLIEAGIDINAANTNEMVLGSSALIKKNTACTALHYAAGVKREKEGCGEHSMVVGDLLEAGAIVNVKNSTGVTPLHVAVLRSDVELVRAFLPRGAHVDFPDSQGRTPLFLAVSNDDVDINIIQALLDAGASPEALVPVGYQHNDVEGPIMREEVQIEITDELVAHNTDQDIKLTSSTLEGGAAKFNSLIQKAAFVEADLEEAKRVRKAMRGERRHLKGLKPIHVAVEKCDGDAVKALIAAGASLNVQEGSTGCTPLHVAVRSKKRVSILQDLIAFGAHLDLRDSTGCTPLRVAARDNNIDALKALIDAGADVSCSGDSLIPWLNPWGVSPLFISIQAGHKDATEILRNAGATLAPGDIYTICLFVFFGWILVPWLLLAKYYGWSPFNVVQDSDDDEII